MESTLFTELTVSEQATVSGGFSLGTFAHGGTFSGGASGTSSGISGGFNTNSSASSTPGANGTAYQTNGNSNSSFTFFG